ncbi:hypothetical protein [Aphanothece sacrum]|uniref:Uncharacterized protein n=1 Tax=Aphanothece sacrum FPU1 TaxID=1920663 RepID=A0A401IHD1_APHSA|nr:hypothetical protein [Aphanothece sacrum]GBF80610.1 hypothetical protein AsFPU1_2014 [Aphanothece sacrum FPU1]GBF84000.1 hypothetical protein AsFPU3_1044 [Aphanothece sacrum FPU3]
MNNNAKLEAIIKWFCSKEFGVIFVENGVFAVVVGLFILYVQNNIETQRIEKDINESRYRVEISMIIEQRTAIIQLMSKYRLSFYQLARQIGPNYDPTIISKIPCKSNKSDSCKPYSISLSEIKEDLKIQSNILFDIFPSVVDTTDLRTKQEDLVKKMAQLNDSLTEEKALNFVYGELQICSKNTTKYEVCQNLEAVNKSSEEYITKINEKLKSVIQSKQK